MDLREPPSRHTDGWRDGRKDGRTDREGAWGAVIKLKTDRALVDLGGGLRVVQCLGPGPLRVKGY